MSIKLKILLFACIISIQSWAQFNYNAKAQNAHNTILNLDFVKYDSQKISQINDNKGIYYWLDGYKCFIEYKTTHKNILTDSVITNIKYQILAIEKLPHSNPFYYYCSSDLYLMLSFLYFEQNEPLKSIRQYFKAKSLINKRQQFYPKFKFGGKHELILYFINSYINQQMDFSLPSQMQIQIQNEYILLLKKFLKTENSTYQRELKLLGTVLFNFQVNSNAKLLIDNLDINIEYAKKGVLESLICLVLFKKNEEYDNQFTILSLSNKLGFNSKINTLNLWYGNALLNQQNDSAIYYINQFLNIQQNFKFVQYAQFKASLYWFLKGNAVKSDSLNRLIINANEYTTAEDKQAVYEISHAKMWTKELVLARVLFDGGNYLKALNVLFSVRQQVSNFSTTQKLEYSYRIARIYNKLDDIKKAEKFYQMVINSNLDNEFYYPAYAAYYLGNMYYKAGNIEKAKKYYNICINLDSPVYKISIHKKARQAMEM